VSIVALELVSGVRLPIHTHTAARLVGAIVIVLAGTTVWQSRYFKDASTFWTRAVHDAPRSAEARYSLGYVHYVRGDLNAAEVHARAAIELVPNNARRSPTYHLGLGLVYEGKGRLPEAAQKYRDAIALDAKFALAHTNLGTIYYREGRLGDAEEKYRESIALEPRFTLAYVNLCALRYQQQRLAEAELFCRKALEIQGDSERALVGLASVHYSQGRYQEAIRDVDQLAARGVNVDQVIPGITEALRAHRR
jgi:Flp pilus assembly protein TadD